MWGSQLVTFSATVCFFRQLLGRTTKLGFFFNWEPFFIYFLLLIFVSPVSLFSLWEGLLWVSVQVANQVWEKEKGTLFDAVQYKDFNFTVVLIFT